MRFEAFVCLFVCLFSILGPSFFVFFGGAGGGGGGGGCRFCCFVLRKIMTLDLQNKQKIYYIIITVNNANNDRFGVLCNRYFSTCDWRVIWCQFVADVKQNLGGF